jgi:hypothetical protein
MEKHDASPSLPEVLASGGHLRFQFRTRSGADQH